MAQELRPTPDQQRALDDLVSQGTLNAEQAGAVRTALWTTDSARKSNPASVLIEVAGYVGGGLILGGALLLVGLNLADLGDTNAALLLAGYAVVLIVAAVLVASGPAALVRLRDDRTAIRRRLVAVLLAVSSGPAALAAAVYADDNATLWSGLVGLVVAVAAYAVMPGVPGLLAMAILSAVATGGAQAIPDHQPLLLTFSFIGLGVLWAVVAVSSLVKPRHIALAVGAIFGIAGAQLALDSDGNNPWAYGLTFVLALLCFVGYWIERATVLLALGVVSTTIAVPEAIMDWTDDSLSGPAILLVSGVVLVAASALGLWLRSRRIEDGARPA